MLIETFLWPSKYPHIFSAFPLRLRTGVLLYGPHGCVRLYVYVCVCMCVCVCESTFGRCAPY